MKTLPVLLVLTFMGGPAVAQQSGDALPERLTGKWEALNMDRFTYNGAETVVFEGSRTPGTVQGRVTHQGVVCMAKDEAFTGTWDGKVLRFEVEFTGMSSKPATCVGRNTYSLERQAGKDVFTGTIRSKNGNMLNLNLAP